MPLAIAERQSQRQCLALTEEEKNSPGSDLASGSDQGEAHWRRQLPASSKALVPVPLAVSRQLSQRRRLVVAEEEEEEEEEGEDSPGSPGGNRDEVHWCHWLPASSKALVPTLLAVSG